MNEPQASLTLPERVLLALVQLHAERGRAPVPLARLTKMLGESASTVMRAITPLSDAAVGDQAGAGWVHIHMDEGRWLVSLTDAGMARFIPA